MKRLPGERGGLLAVVAAAVASLWLGLAALEAHGQPARSSVAAGLAPSEEIIAIPSVDGINLQTRVRRPRGDGPYPLAIINHGSPPNASQRPAMEVPTFRPATEWLLSKGYMVALPLRRGYGQTGGRWAEAYGRCGDPDYYRAGLATADDIEAVIAFFR
jgi:dipeptidyl aminopeptidase/acylaminoacyl peptidase